MPDTTDANDMDREIGANDFKVEAEALNSGDGRSPEVETVRLHDCYLCKRPVGLIRKGICRPYRYEVIEGEEVPVCMNKRQCKLAESRKVEA
jgi:hypothetical protein